MSHCPDMMRNAHSDNVKFRAVYSAPPRREFYNSRVVEKSKLSRTFETRGMTELLNDLNNPIDHHILKSGN